MQSSILQKIKNYKLKEISLLKENHGLKRLEIEALEASPPKGFLKKLAVKKLPEINIIAEIKKASPSRGIISENFDPMRIASSYEQAGASCISVLTDFPSFKGTRSDFEIVRNTTALPILRKDFIFDQIQVFESRSMGADCILIILAALSDSEAKEIEERAFALNMDVILEVHNREELDRALTLESKLIGINNRDLKTFHTNLDTTESLHEFVPTEYHVISESGFFSRADLDRISQTSINSFLIGESLMKSNDIQTEFKKLLEG